ncbi:MAG: sigma-70 family RNA polymerase sigma factor, partial [Acutalibacteraceae bacterium]|nr:sigma-70 family RNA polymerase sigma factor [Acutalibacteraceae bacterium]
MEVDKQRISELVVKIQNGNKSAFDELYKLTSERAYFIALEFTKNNQDAEDILQESYIKALSKINELDKPESFSSWFNQIVANKSKDFLKKKKPMLFKSDEEETAATEFLPDEDTNFSPEENLDQTELQKTVME